MHLPPTLCELSTLNKTPVPLTRVLPALERAVLEVLNLLLQDKFTGSTLEEIYIMLASFFSRSNWQHLIC